MAASDSDSDYFIEEADVLSDVDDDCDEEAFIGAAKPYLFEPELDIGNLNLENSRSSEDTPAPELRLVSRSWCQCDNCIIMDTSEECTCCQEIQATYQKLVELEDCGYTEIPKCIVQHPGFSGVCLDIWVLQAAYLAFKQQHGDHDGTQHQRYRYTAYRQLVRWCWGYLGKDVRVVLPACAVTLIRNTFPSDTYKGFSLPRLDL